MQCLNDFTESNSVRFADSPCTEITNVKNCVGGWIYVKIGPYQSALCVPGLKITGGIRVYFKFICGRRQF